MGPRAGLDEGRRGGAENLASPPPRLDPMTVQPVASRYIDCTVPAVVCRLLQLNIDYRIALPPRRNDALLARVN